MFPMDIHNYLDYVSVDIISKCRNSKLVEKHVTFFSETSNRKAGFSGFFSGELNWEYVPTKKSKRAGTI